MISRGMRRGRLATLALALMASMLVLLPAAPPAAQADSTQVVFDDMEHGDPFNNGWFAFGGAVGGGGIAANSIDLPPGTAGSFSLESGWGSGGVPGFFGGFGRTNLVDLSGTAHFNFWINPDAGQDYTLEINLQDDDNGDDAITDPDDDEFQYNCVVAAAGPCAVSGGGWQLVSIPLADFFDDNSFLTGGNGVLDPVPATAGGNGQLVNVVIAVISNSGADATFRTDDWVFSDTPLVVPTIIDDFESGLPFGADGNGNLIGFFTFNDGNSTVEIDTTDIPPAAVPGSEAGNNVLQMDADVEVFAGFLHAFENAAVDTWVTQDWSASEGFAFWLYGSNSGTDLFIDVLDNRNPGSTTDDAERWTVAFKDDFSGWQYLEFPFADFVRKEIGNGAPNDGFGLTEVHGWAFGTLNTGGPASYFLDDVSLYGVAELPELAVGFSTASFDIDEGTTGDITVKLNRPMNEDDPAQVSVDYSTEPGSATPDRDYVPVSGTLTFVNGGPSELAFSLETFPDGKWEGTQTVILRLSNPVDVAPGFIMQAGANIIDADAFDPLLLDDFERGIGLWDSSANAPISNPEIAAGDPDALPGQGSFEGVLAASVLSPETIDVQGRVCNQGSGVIPVRINSTADFDATTIDHRTVRLGDAAESHVDNTTGEPKRHEAGDDLIFHFRFEDTGLPCDPEVIPLTGLTFDGDPIVGQVWRDFAIGQDWSPFDGLTFWYYGTGSGDEISVTLKDNRAPDPGPAGWDLVWADEFDDPAGTPPNPDNWGFEIGDGSVNGIPGWGNDELQYYTDSTDNVATDGAGNLVITAREADGSLQCYYGPCEYTSARLVTKDKAEFAYGRIESRILVPDGDAGLWPAFWSLGTDIDVVSWPQTGEIDFMEYVSRLPNEIFGTIHGPGYSGGQSFGNVYDFGEPVYDDYHTFTIEWQPDRIEWYVDGILYHTAEPADVAPNQWVFNDPVYLLLNMAIGGNFGGALGDDLVFPQELKVDYVRIYQGPDTAERWEASFVDDVAGWRQVDVPFTNFTRSATQPIGAPDDGLGLSEVWGYGFGVKDITADTEFKVDQVRLLAPSEVVVTSAADAGAGSLRAAIASVAPGGTVTIDPSLANATIALTSGPLVVSKSVVIDGAAAPGVIVSGGGSDRVLIVDPGAFVEVRHLTLTDGYGWQLAGCVLNNGALTLDHVTVTGCTMDTDAGDFWQGGGGIYSGEGATLNLIDSTVADNTAAWSGGGVYGFFNTTTTIMRSTISGNVSGDVGGAIRSLGDAEIVNSTISGNESTGWYGGAAFITDGVVNVVNSTVAGNVSPSFAPADLFVGTFTDASATLTLTNTIVSSAQDGCFAGFFGGGAVTLLSNGHNVGTDATCNLTATGDQPSTDPLLGPLAGNGGPTLTHALLAGSPAIDAADAAACPATDQRGVARPQGAGCDVGAFELE